MVLEEARTALGEDLLAALDSDMARDQATTIITTDFQQVFANPSVARAKDDITNLWSTAVRKALDLFAGAVGDFYEEEPTAQATRAEGL